MTIEALCQGEIISATNFGVGVVKQEDPLKFYPFTFDKIVGYSGQYVKEMGLTKGTTVHFTLDENDSVSSVKLPLKEDQFIDKRSKLLGRWTFPWAVKS